ncbi:hypothetical protein [Azospirillum rugosum]|uniref:Uncharacterized protein n=1 Tax=Azospirillum rugosum TaxID=416170 RepID=A0ABS4SR47_9PROT|nr:hypothetical protein [Azospirillum rugosum]MBP2295046.1 hypothetical protein [Azospirillum rugosum]MDQ0528869.1 hypothetical protein [Azospirillum rugosum]
MPGKSAILWMVLVLVALPALAQTAPSPSGQDKAQRVTNSPDVRASQLPNPTPQGTRPPDPIGAPVKMSELWNALQGVWRAPPDLQGEPVPRPNEWASNPDNPAEPTRSENPSDLTSHEVRP